MRKRDLIINFLRLIWRKKEKAAPRFELGIKDLQSSALPLGHAALEVINTTTLDRIRQKKKSVLVLSNGHGEDLIALRIIEALHRLDPSLQLGILPLVGEGKIFTKVISDQWVLRKGTSCPLPSGGFSNQSLKGLLADLWAGVVGKTLKNMFAVRTAAQNGVFIIAIGDLLPLFCAWMSGGLYGFIGTPKSDYTWLTASGLFCSDRYHRMKGTEWDPWEWYLMKSSRCKIVAMRDKITARGLRRKGVKAIAPGNPMMDGLETLSNDFLLFKKERRLLLLCGSRMPEALTNFQRLLNATELIESESALVIFVVLGPVPLLGKIEDCLFKMGFQRSGEASHSFDADAVFEKDQIKLVVGVGKFEKWAKFAEVGIANAGTATEQLVGLGTPCVSLPGNGPQFKYGFAIRQSRLLGGSVIPAKSSQHMAQIVGLLLRDNQLRNSLGVVGKKRMGDKGGSHALAQIILEVVSEKNQFGDNFQ